MGTSVYSGDSATGVPPSAVVAAAIATDATDIGIPSDPAAVTTTVTALHLFLKLVISRLTASLFRAPGSGFRISRGVGLLFRPRVDRKNRQRLQKKARSESLG